MIKQKKNKKGTKIIFCDLLVPQNLLHGIVTWIKYHEDNFRFIAAEGQLLKRTERKYKMLEKEPIYFARTKLEMHTDQNYESGKEVVRKEGKSLPNLGMC
jgi:hypothetical protein